MNWFWRLLLFIVGQRAKIRFVGHMKKKGVLVYLRTLQGIRRITIGGVCAYILLQIMIFALVGAAVSGFFLWEADFKYKLQVALVTCLGLFFVPALGLVVLFSQRLWYRASGADRLVESLHRKGQARD